MIKVTNFSKYYGDFLAVDDISFDVKKGEILALLGPNGAGKSTTIKNICCFLKPSKGNIEIKGKNVLEEEDEIKKMIGYLPESAPLYGEMLVYDFLKYVARVKKIHNMNDKILEIADLCGIRKKLSSSIGNLSKGLKQRVGIAQALIGDPEILILDEPTSGLDPNQIIEIREVIKEIGKKKTVILSTHILSEVEATCDRAIIINKGKIILDSNVDEFLLMQDGEMILEIDLIDAKIEDVELAFGQFEWIKKIKVNELDHVCRISLHALPKEMDQKQLYELIKSKSWIIIKMIQKQRSLEDIFRELTI